MIEAALSDNYNSNTTKIKTLFNFTILTSIAAVALFSFYPKGKGNEKKGFMTDITPNNSAKTLVTTQQIIDLANAFKATLSSSQIATLELAYTFANAKTWSNLPASMSPRIGLKLGTLTTPQLTAARNLIQALSGKGRRIQRNLRTLDGGQLSFCQWWRNCVWRRQFLYRIFR